MVEKLRMKRSLEARAKTEDFLALLIRSLVSHLSGPFAIYYSISILIQK